MSDYHYLPGILREIADVAGLSAALAIADKKGGARTFFPARAPDGHWLPQLVGREAADKICTYFRRRDRTDGVERASLDAGTYMLIPLGPKNFYAKARRRAVELTAEGWSREEVARRLGIHIRSVQRYRGRMRDETDGPQGSLF
ncbi:helix-turn-helix domain-containing protein [Methylosinus sp. H3A]|uniref:helix-turn-helix domain-containing protein n=1 Tax=Methylosinus sp. H3A TaxID=2785786 RepID=UPI001AEE5A3A|nr:helix-turn-helix domain-containing protein [Methylosinus sp. H3A]